MDSDDSPIMTAKEYHERAKRLRALAAATTTASLRQKLLALGDEYERSAQRARGREALILSFVTSDSGKSTHQ